MRVWHGLRSVHKGVSEAHVKEGVQVTGASWEGWEMM